jgi:hypothetical protein
VASSFFRSRIVYEAKHLKSHRPRFYLVLLLLSFVRTASAVRDDYIDETLVFQTIDEGAIELEYWFDYGNRSHEGIYFQRHNVALEYGITHRLMIDTRLTVEDPNGGSANFDSGRFEVRYRFAEEGAWPVDVALSGELNTARLENDRRQYGIEPRLILSRDFAKLNVTLNLAEEVPVNRGSPSLEVASGVRYSATELVRLGSELKYDVHDQSAAVIPQIWFAFPHEITLKIGYSKGFARNPENFVRFAIAMEF